MKWLLLNQSYVHMEWPNLSVLEEVVSSEQSLVLLLASGSISRRTGMSVYHGLQDFNLIVQGDRL